MDIIKVIDRDIAEVKERIKENLNDKHYATLLHDFNLQDADDVLELVNQWDRADDQLSFDAGYIAGLEACKRTYQNKYKLKSVLARLKPKLRYKRS